MDSFSCRNSNRFLLFHIFCVKIRSLEQPLRHIYEVRRIHNFAIQFSEGELWVTGGETPDHTVLSSTEVISASKQVSRATKNLPELVRAT